MRSVLEGCREKVARAEQHIGDFHMEGCAFLKTNPYRVEPQQRPDVVQDVRLVFYGPEPPLALSIIFGDAIHNLRSALDHLAWASVPTGVRCALKEGQQRRIAFPVCLQKRLFKGQQVVIRAQEDAVALIDRHQPYKRGFLAHTHPLAILESLSRTDKHRAIYTAAAIPDVEVFDAATRHNPNALLLRRSVMLEDNTALKGGTEIARLTFKGGGPHPEVHVEGEIPFRIVLQDGARRAPEIRPAEIARYVRRIIEDFAVLWDED